MRTAYRVWSGLAAATFVTVAVVDISTMSNETPEPASATSSYSTPSSYGPGWSSGTTGTSSSSGYSASGNDGYRSSSTPPAIGESVTVTDVVDGDTFEIAGGREVRVLGIDSCEAGTAGGQEATELARDQLMSSVNQPVTLTKQPGVETDRYGRELRYVQLGGTDFGTFMVRYPHTGVFEGRNDADPSYVSSLRTSDDGPRSCSGPVETTTRTPPPTEIEDDDHVYVDPYESYESYDSGGGSGSSGTDDSDGGESSHTGDSGHPCLPGERDGDNDGYCGES